MKNNNEQNMTVKEFVSSPWIRVIAVLLGVFITATGVVVARAETNINERIKMNRDAIDDVEGEMERIKEEVNDMERTQAEISTTLEFIRQATEEIKADVKSLRKR